MTDVISAQVHPASGMGFIFYFYASVIAPDRYGTWPLFPDTRLFSSMLLYVHRDPIKTVRDAGKPRTSTSTFTQLCWLLQIQVQCCFTHCVLYGLCGERERESK